MSGGKAIEAIKSRFWSCTPLQVKIIYIVRGKAPSMILNILSPVIEIT